MKVKYVIFSFLLILIFVLPSYASVDFNTVEEVENYIEEYYPFELNNENNSIELIKKMIENLQDPYTEYFSSEENESFVNDVNQTLTGIGVRMQGSDVGGIITAVMPFSPAEKAGLLAGDIIVSVNDQSVKGKNVTEIVEMVRGIEGTNVNIGVLHENSIIDSYTLIRAQINVPQVEEKILADNTGIIAIHTFGDRTVEEFKECISNLEDSGVEKLIIDLRGDGGGYVNAAMEIAEYFVDGPAFYMKGKDGVYYPQRADYVKNIQDDTIVLVDEFSASASEILAACMKDSGYKIVGAKSYGKGVMQRIFPLTNGDYLKLTVAEFVSPNKKTINKVGVEPDFKVMHSDIQPIRAWQLLNTQINPSITYHLNKSEFEINGNKCSVAEGPYMENSIIELPLIETIEGLGGEIVSISKDSELTIEVSFNSSKIQNKKFTKSDLVIKNDEIFINSENLNGYASVDLNEVNGTIKINKLNNKV